MPARTPLQSAAPWVGARTAAAQAGVLAASPVLVAVAPNPPYIYIYIYCIPCSCLKCG